MKNAARFPYYFAWKNNDLRRQYYGKPCRLVAAGALNSILIEFENGRRLVTSRNAIRRIPRSSHGPKD